MKVEQRMSNIAVYKHVKGIRSTLIDAALSELVEKKCLTKETNAIEKSYTLLGFGRNVYDTGGFKEYLKELNRQAEFKNLLDEYSLKTNQSVIDTNALVRQNVRTQERLTKYALTIAFFAALFPAITLVKDILRPQQLIDKDTQQVMKDQKVAIDSLRQNLDSINASLKNLKTVSYYGDTIKRK